MSVSDSFRTARWLRTINLVLQAVLFLSLFGGLNYLARNHAWRIDLTRQRKFSLTPETLSYVRNIERPVHIVVTLSEENDNPEVRGLLDEYVYVTEDSANGRITKEYLDVYQNRRRAEELGVEQPDLILLLSGQDKRRTVPINELYRMREKQRDAFQGEQVLTSALLDVASSGRQKIYFLVGHGEFRPEDSDGARGLTSLRFQLRTRNFEVESLDLTATRQVPADAALLVSVAPRSRYTPIEQELLRQYLSAKAGRLIFMLAPGNPVTALGIDDLLFDWGILVQDDVICDVGFENITETGDLLIRAFAPHPITDTLLGHKEKLTLGVARTVRPDPGRAAGSGLTTVTVAATSTTAWGERDYRSGQPASPTRGVDTLPLPNFDDGRLGVIVASERVGVKENLPFTVPGGRLVVFGAAELVTNNRIDNSGLMVFLNAVNWSVDRDRQLNIAARPIERFQLSLSAAEFQQLRYALLLGLPGGTLFLGLIVYWARRV